MELKQQKTISVPYEDAENLFMSKIIPNSLIMNLISNHLSLHDLLQLAATSKSVCSTLRSEILPSRCILTLRPIAVRHNFDATPRMRWKDVWLQVDGWSRKEMSQILNHLRTVTTLQLVQTLFEQEIQISKSDSIKILQAPHHLKSLSLNGVILCLDLNGLFTPQIIKMLGNLDELSFHHHRKNGYEHEHDGDDNRFCLYPMQHEHNQFPFKNDAESVRNFEQNFNQLLKISPLPRLTSFRIFSFETRLRESKNQVRALITQFITAHKETLQILKLDEEMWQFEQSGHFSKQVFPRLVSLELDTGICISSHVTNFLQIQPPLSNLVVTATYCSVDRAAGLIVARDPKKGGGQKLFKILSTSDLSNLKNLELQVDRKLFVKEAARHDDPSILNWTFLKKAPNLNSFNFFFICSRPSEGKLGGGEGNISRILENLNPRVEHIFISGLCERKDGTQNSDFSSIFSKFSNLRSLKFTACQNPLCNDSLADIFKNCTNLTELAFSWCDQVTNDGISSGIQSLTNLEVLWFLRCPKLNREVLPCLRFKGLRDLSFLFTPQDQCPTSEELVTLVEGNPSLRLLNYSTRSIADEEKLPLLLRAIGKSHVELDPDRCDN